jgi:hypothetical protein
MRLQRILRGFYFVFCALRIALGLIHWEARRHRFSRMKFCGIYEFDGKIYNKKYHMLKVFIITILAACYGLQHFREIRDYFRQSSTVSK